jgi:hypothetical protein
MASTLLSTSGAIKGGTSFWNHTSSSSDSDSVGSIGLDAKLADAPVSRHEAMLGFPTIRICLVDDAIRLDEVYGSTGVGHLGEFDSHI